MNPNNEKDLEQFVHRTLRSLPERRAPRTLEHRVLAAIAARNALPWYRHSFTSWPLAARAAFLAASLGSATAIALLGSTGLTPLREGVTNAIARLEPLQRAGSTLASTGENLVNTIPSLWLYGGLAVVAFAYLSLFGLGATAYRTLTAKH